MTLEQIENEIKFWSGLVAKRHSQGLEAKFEKRCVEELQKSALLQFASRKSLGKKN